MTWVFIIIAIVGYFVYSFHKDYKEAVQTTLTNYGGITNKYSLLISVIGQGAKITKTTKDNITIVSNDKKIMWTIDVVGYDVEIRVRGSLPFVGNIDKKWVYPHDYNQEQMVKEIGAFMSHSLEQMQNNIIQQMENNEL